MVELPIYEGVDVRDVIAERSMIKSVKANFSVEFEKGDGTMTGEAAMEMTDETLDLRLYSFGFLIAELTEANGVIKSRPELNKSRSVMLVDGLRNGIFWWNIKDYEVEEQDETYLLKNGQQSISIDKKTMLPKYQILELENGRELKISYEEPMCAGKICYPSRMRIEFSRYIAKLKIKRISFAPVEI